MLHTIHFICPVNANTVSQLQSSCLGAMSRGATEINIHISSGGGETHSGFAAYAFLKSLPIKVRTHNISNVESIANVIFLAGSERFANPLARFLLHPLSYGFAAATLDHDRLREIGYCLDNDLERFIQVLNIEASSSVEWMREIKNSTILNTEEAISYGVVHGSKPAVIESSHENNWLVTINN